MRCGVGPLAVGCADVSSRVQGIGTSEFKSQPVEVTVSVCLEFS